MGNRASKTASAGDDCCYGRTFHSWGCDAGGGRHLSCQSPAAGNGHYRDLNGIVYWGYERWTMASPSVMNFLETKTDLRSFAYINTSKENWENNQMGWAGMVWALFFNCVD